MGKITFHKGAFREPDLPAREEKIRQTVLASWQGFLAAQAKQTMSLWEFIYCQSRYIKKVWWLLQAVLLACLACYMRMPHETIFVRQTLGISAPLFIILVIPELLKNQSCNAMSIESATMYTLRQVYSARLTLFAGVDLLLLTVFCLGVTTSKLLTVWELMIQFVLPVNVTCCICLTCLYCPRVSGSALPLALCFAFIGIWREIVRDETLYEAISIPSWSGMLALSLAYMAYCVFHGQKNWKRNLEIRMSILIN